MVTTLKRTTGSQRGWQYHGEFDHRRTHAQRGPRILLLRRRRDPGDDHAADGHRFAIPSDSKGDYLDGATTYKVTLPKDIPAEKFWSLTVYDNQSRSMLDRSQRYPRAGRQRYPSPAAGKLRWFHHRLFQPNQTGWCEEGNWIQTDPKKGWNTLLRLYSPLESFFTKTWRPTEIELVGATVK